MLRLSVVLFSFAPIAAVSSQTKIESAVVTPCILQNRTEHCSELGTRAAFAAATSVAIESGQRDRVGASQLQSFITSLGKSVALDTQSADVALKLSPIEEGGVTYGAADRELARLEVYARVGPEKQQQLIWVETLSGPADLSWPASVARLLDQLRHRLKTN